MQEAIRTERKASGACTATTFLIGLGFVLMGLMDPLHDSYVPVLLAVAGFTTLILFHQILTRALGLSQKAGLSCFFSQGAAVVAPPVTGGG